MQKHKRIIGITSFFFLSLSALAQDEERYYADSNVVPTSGSGAIHLLKLKKGYKIGDGLTISSSKGTFNVTQTLQTSYAVNSPNKNLSGLNSTFSINRARLTLISNLFENKFSTVFRINFTSNYQSATSGARSFNTTLQEAYFEYRPNRRHTFNIGLRADYIDSREIRMQGENLGFINRSAVSESFDAIFDYGIRYKGNFKLGGKHLLRPYASITTGDSRSSLQRNFGGFKYGLRLDYLPFDKFTSGGEYYMDDLVREEKPKLVLGVVYSYNDGQSSFIGTNGGRYLYGDSSMNILLPKFSKFGFDYLFKYRGFYSMGSIFATQSDVPSNIKGEYRLNGTFSNYSTTQTDEQTKNLVRSRLNLGSGLSIQAGYLFPSDIGIAFRYASLNANASSTNFADYNKYYTFALNKYLNGHDLKVQLEVGFDQLSDQLKTPTQNGNFYSQLMFTIQL